jgi:NAD(P)-dependent dehydrogenase (short-subunit alcohol dehydrogenase family)
MRHVIITGASRGLGRALALGFAAKGWTVSACATGATAIQTLANELGPEHLALTCDVTRPGEVGAFAARVLERFGPPDLLLNNAAVINRNAPLWEVSAEEFSRVIDVNLKGVHAMIRAVLPVMIQRGRGVVVNFSSGWGRSTSPEVAPYCATKWGIEGLTAALAAELPDGLAAVALNPGIIDTRMLRSCFGEAAGAYPTPERWAAVAVPFLAALGPRHNGQALTVPDGR